MNKFWAWVDENPCKYMLGILIVTCVLAVVYG